VSAGQATAVVPDVRTDLRHIACRPTGRSAIVVPLLDGKEVLGVLAVDSDDIDAFAAEDQALLGTVASHLVARFRRNTTKSLPHEESRSG